MKYLACEILFEKAENVGNFRKSPRGERSQKSGDGKSNVGRWSEMRDELSIGSYLRSKTLKFLSHMGNPRGWRNFSAPEGEIFPHQTNYRNWGEKDLSTKSGAINRMSDPVIKTTCYLIERDYFYMRLDQKHRTLSHMQELKCNENPFISITGMDKWVGKFSPESIRYYKF